MRTIEPAQQSAAPFNRRTVSRRVRSTNERTSATKAARCYGAAAAAARRTSRSLRFLATCALHSAATASASSGAMDVSGSCIMSCGYSGKGANSGRRTVMTLAMRQARVRSHLREAVGNVRVAAFALHRRKHVSARFKLVRTRRGGIVA